MTTTSPYCALTPKMALQLASPHTWAAAIMPVFLAFAVSCAQGISCSLVMCYILLAICILMQSSVNTFNDYFDYVKGTDSEDDNVEVDDATLVYNNVNPKHALALAVGYLAVAFLLGLYVIYQCGLVPLGIALVGAFFVVAYSAGKTPLSYLPIGEAVSGLVMGCLIPLACHYSLTMKFDPRMIVWSLPCIIGIALIMFTNNTCDIEKDIQAERSTLPVILGRGKTRTIYHGFVVLWLACISVIVAVWFTPGCAALPFFLLASYPLCKGLFKNPLIAQSRVGAMGMITAANVAFNGLYVACIAFSSYGSLLTL